MGKKDIRWTQSSFMNSGINLNVIKVRRTSAIYLLLLFISLFRFEFNFSIADIIIISFTSYFILKL